MSSSGFREYVGLILGLAPTSRVGCAVTLERARLLSSGFVRRLSRHGGTPDGFPPNSVAFLHA